MGLEGGFSRGLEGGERVIEIFMQISWLIFRAKSSTSVNSSCVPSGASATDTGSGFSRPRLSKPFFAFYRIVNSWSIGNSADGTRNSQWVNSSSGPSKGNGGPKNSSTLGVDFRSPPPAASTHGFKYTDDTSISKVMSFISSAKARTFLFSDAWKSAFQRCLA